MYCDLVPIGVDMFSAQCFVFDLVWASFLISSLYFSLFMWSMIFFRTSFDIWGCFSSRWYSFIISLTIFCHRLFSSDVMRLTSESSLFSSQRACIIFFLFMVYFMGNWPVSASRMLVGVPWGSARIVFIALLRIVWSRFSSFLVRFQLSDPYVMMGINVASNSCNTACIFIPLNYLLPVSVMIFSVTAWIFVSVASIWASTLFFLLMSSPRYL